jgi:hypothetical protein
MLHYSWRAFNALPRMFSIVRTISHWVNDDEMESIKCIAPACNINHVHSNIFAMYKTMNTDCLVKSEVLIKMRINRPCSKWPLILILISYLNGRRDLKRSPCYVHPNTKFHNYISKFLIIWRVQILHYT